MSEKPILKLDPEQEEAIFLAILISLGVGYYLGMLADEHKIKWMGHLIVGTFAYITVTLIIAEIVEKIIKRYGPQEKEEHEHQD